VILEMLHSIAVDQLYMPVIEFARLRKLENSIRRTSSNGDCGCVAACH
jgi:hypothetical protein